VNLAMAPLSDWARFLKLRAAGATDTPSNTRSSKVRGRPIEHVL
jgi:hypothetical protein